MPRGNKQKILEYQIALTPLEVQQRIVDILDRFNALTTSLTDGLPAEIEARRKQYAYYRDQLLTFPEKPTQNHPQDTNEHDAAAGTIHSTIET